jgi:hypothetical protein
VNLSEGKGKSDVWKLNRDSTMKRGIIEAKKRDAITCKILTDLEGRIAAGDGDASRVLAIYERIYKLGSGISRNDAFYFLACAQLQFRAECPLGHYSENRYFHFCRRRYWCNECLSHAINTQQMKWINLIRSTIAQSEFLHLGPLVRLEWTIPDPLDRDHLRSFSRYFDQTWPLKLRALGVPENGWMLGRVFDPIQAKIRALYLGPSADWSKICRPREKRQKTNTSGLNTIRGDSICIKSASNPGRRRGQETPWTPSLVGRPQYLIDRKLKLIGSDLSIEFWKRIETSVRWAIGTTTSMLKLPPDLAIKLSRLYHKRHLKALHGLAYGRSNKTFRESIDNPNSVIVVEYRDGITSLLPSVLAGSFAEPDIVRIPDPSDRHDPDTCPECNRPLLLRVHEARFNRKHSQKEFARWPPASLL